jgi:hypothetical protein
MKLYSFFHRETGLIHPNKFATDDDSQLPGNTPKDHVAFEGHHDHLSKRVDLATATLVEYIPPIPSPDHVWNPEIKRWQLSAAVADRQAKRLKALGRIRELEFLSLRPLREHALGLEGAAARLAAIDAEIIELRKVFVSGQ